MNFDLLARVAASSSNVEGVNAKPVSILSLAAASYGSQPATDSTIPTGFDPAACALFEAIIEGAYLVAAADGIFDDTERGQFERVVAVACGGAVSPRMVSDLVADLEDQLAEDGLERRMTSLASTVHKPEHAREILRIAALLAQASDDVSDSERTVLVGLARALTLPAEEVDLALQAVRSALSHEIPPTSQ